MPRAYSIFLRRTPTRKHLAWRDRLDPAIVKAAVAAAPDGMRRAADRIRRIERRCRETICDEVNPTASGAELLEIDPLEAAEILCALA